MVSKLPASYPQLSKELRKMGFSKGAIRRAIKRQRREEELKTLSAIDIKVMEILREE